MGSLFVCKFCRNPYVALPEHQVHAIFKDEDGNNVAVFSKVVNVMADKDHYLVFPHTVADIYCVRCGDKLGFKYIQIGSQYVMQDKRIKNGYVQILTEKISTSYGDE